MKDRISFTSIGAKWGGGYQVPSVYGTDIRSLHQLSVHLNAGFLPLLPLIAEYALSILIIGSPESPGSL